MFTIWSGSFRGTSTENTARGRVTPHISLKQPFNVSNLPTLETYMDTLAGSLQPFELTLTELQAVPIVFDRMEYSILWIDVEETEGVGDVPLR